MLPDDHDFVFPKITRSGYGPSCPLSNEAQELARTHARADLFHCVLLPLETVLVVIKEDRAHVLKKKTR